MHVTVLYIHVCTCTVKCTAISNWFKLSTSHPLNAHWRFHPDWEVWVFMYWTFQQRHTKHYSRSAFKGKRGGGGAGVSPPQKNFCPMYFKIFCEAFCSKCEFNIVSESWSLSFSGGSIAILIQIPFQLKNWNLLQRWLNLVSGSYEYPS